MRGARGGRLQEGTRSGHYLSRPTQEKEIQHGSHLTPPDHSSEGQTRLGPALRRDLRPHGETLGRALRPGASRRAPHHRLRRRRTHPGHPPFCPGTAGEPPLRVSRHGGGVRRHLWAGAGQGPGLRQWADHGDGWLGCGPPWRPGLLFPGTQRSSVGSDDRVRATGNGGWSTCRRVETPRWVTPHHERTLAEVQPCACHITSKAPGFHLPSCGANTRRTDVRYRPKCRAIAAWLSPCCASDRICTASLAWARGRPWAFPRLRASVMPALIRSRIKSRSNSANTARKPAKARPAGVVRSRASVNETKPTPRAVSSCSVVIKSTSERPQRSSFHTRITSSFRCLAAVSSAWRFGRRSLAPDAISSTVAMMVQPRRVANSCIASICMARVCWSRVETRA